MTQKVVFPKYIINRHSLSSEGWIRKFVHVKDGFMQDFMKIVKTKMINMGKI